MEIYVNATKLHGGCSPAMRAMIEDKLSFANNFVKPDEQIKVSLDKVGRNKNSFKIHTSLVLNDNYHIHVDSSGNDFESALSDMKDDISDCITRHNTKKKDNKKRRGFKEKREYKDSIIEASENFIDSDNISKRKDFTIELLSESEAISRMEEIGHDTYVFKNSDRNGAYSMLYRREADESYGVITFHS